MKLPKQSFLDCFVEDELGSSCAETLVTYLAVSRQVCGEGPDTGRSRKGILRGCCETFPSRMAVELVSMGRKTFDVRLHCANSPCDQTTRLPQHLGKVQKRDTARLLRNFLVLKTIAISASGPSYNVYLVGKL